MLLQRCRRLSLDAASSASSLLLPDAEVEVASEEQRVGTLARVGSFLLLWQRRVGARAAFEATLCWLVELWRLLCGWNGSSNILVQLSCCVVTVVCGRAAKAICASRARSRELERCFAAVRSLLLPPRHYLGIQNQRQLDRRAKLDQNPRTLHSPLPPNLARLQQQTRPLLI